MRHYRPLEFKDNTPNVEEAITALQSAFDTKMTTLTSDIEKLKSTTTDPKLIERLDKLEAKINRPGATADDVKEAVELEKKAFHSYLRYGKDAGAEELKTLTVSSDTQGGYLAPTEMSTEFIRELVQYSPIRGLASVRSTSSPSVAYPSRTGRTNAKWKGETETQETGEPSFGQVEIPVREINTYVDISNQLLADSQGMAEAEVRMAMSEDFGLKEGTAFLKGSGPKQPEGLLTANGVAYTPTGNANTLGSAPADLLIDFMYSLPTPYRNRGSWLMNSKTLGALRKLKDGQGNFLWQPSFQVGQPEQILGRPVTEVPDMDDVGAGNVPIIFGDIATAYRVIDRIGLSILVNPYLLATNGITRIHATRRVGAGVVQPAAIRKLKVGTN